MRIKNMWLVIFLLGFLIVISSSCQAAWWGPREGRKVDPEDMIARRLKLNEDQIKLFKQHAQKVKKDNQASQERIKQFEEALKSEMSKDTPDTNKIHDLIKNIGSQRTEIQLKRMDDILDLQKSLTKEQRAEFNKMIGDRRPPHESGRGPKPGPEGRPAN